MIGKRIAGDHYIHRNYIGRLEVALQDLYKSARKVLASTQKDKWNLVKINSGRRKVSFLHYPQFDEKAHPELNQSISVNLSVSPPTVRVIKGGGQILHRKELFVAKDYKHYLKFFALTRKEEELGLLDKNTLFKGKKLGTIIGRKVVWEEWLQFNEVTVKDHEVVKTTGRS